MMMLIDMVWDSEILKITRKFCLTPNTDYLVKHNSCLLAVVDVTISFSLSSGKLAEMYLTIQRKLIFKNIGITLHFQLVFDSCSWRVQLTI